MKLTRTEIFVLSTVISYLENQNKCLGLTEKGIKSLAKIQYKFFLEVFGIESKDILKSIENRLKNNPNLTNTQELRD